MTIREAYLLSRKQVSTLYNENETQSICKRLFSDKFSISANELITSADQVFSEMDKLNECLQRLLGLEPIQHITGFELFHGLRIVVNSDVLIPRPETAELVDWVLESIPINSTLIIADICTGSGCIALALKKRLKKASIIATDISEKALELAAKNELLNFPDGDILFVRHDLLEESWSFDMPDIIVCNPPYIASTEAGMMSENVMKFEPRQALFVPYDDTLIFYKKIIHTFLQKPSTHIYFELNPLTALALKVFCDKMEIKTRFRKDLYGKTRFAHIYL